MTGSSSLQAGYWSDLQVTKQDIESLHNHLFDLETPLTARVSSASVCCGSG